LNSGLVNRIEADSGILPKVIAQVRLPEPGFLIYLGPGSPVIEVEMLLQGVKPLCIKLQSRLARLYGSS
jgi:hypothetical protein